MLKGDSSSTSSTLLRSRQVRDVLGVRHIQAILLAGALFVHSVQEGNVGTTAITFSNGLPTNDTCPWEFDEASTLDGSYFYAMIVSSFLGGYLTYKCDNKVLLMGSFVIGTILTYMTPSIIKHYNFDIFNIVKCFQGASKGLIKPLVYSQLVRWLPPDELMLIGPVVLSGIYLGDGVIIILGGFMSTGQGGWPSIFYFSGNLGFIWCLAYIGLGSQSPNTCFYISIHERKYIEDCLPLSIRSQYREHIPWKKIVTCAPILALIILQSANNYGMESLHKIFPVFYYHNLGLDIKEIGLLMGLPYFCVSILIIIKYHVLKQLFKKRKLTYSEVRHICSGIGQFGAFYFYMYSAFSYNNYVSFVFHCIGMILSSFQLNGFYMNYFDLSPNYVGLVVGIVNSVSYIFCILGPYVSSRFYKHHVEDHFGSKSPFKAKESIYFFIAMFYLCSGILWEIFGSTKVQPFNDIRENEEQEEHQFNESDIIKM